MTQAPQRLLRSRTEKVIAGVAGGIASYVSVDPVIIRLAFLALIFTGVGLFLYPILWVIMPIEGSQKAGPAQAFHEIRDAFTKGQNRQPHYDSVTGQPISDETEIPINTIGGDTPVAPPADRNRQLGILLLGIGGFVLASIVLGPHFGKLLFPILLIGAGVLALRRE
jgi:phage shock protein C